MTIEDDNNALEN